MLQIQERGELGVVLVEHPAQKNAVDAVVGGVTSTVLAVERVSCLATPLSISFSSRRSPSISSSVLRAAPPSRAGSNERVPRLFAPSSGSSRMLQLAFRLSQRILHHSTRDGGGGKKDQVTVLLEL